MLGLFNRFCRRARRDLTQRERSLRFESVEGRQMMSVSHAVPSGDWFDTSLRDSGVRTLARVDYQDGQISRDDMLGLFAEVEADGKVTAAERLDLNALGNSHNGLSMSDDVRDLTRDVAGANLANRHYQGHSLGNLKAGDRSAKLEKLVDKWFYGEDLPVTDKFSQYQNISGELFVNGATYSDIKQGASGDCYLMSSLAELTIKDPSAIQNMFVDNGDGTYAVRFYQRGVSRYVTVNTELPVYYYQGSVGAEYASYATGSGGNELWVALTEKAYCQINEEGWAGHGSKNSYKAINSGSPVDTIPQITSDTTGFTGINARSSSTMLSTIVSDFNSGQTITFATKNRGTAPNILNDHSYAMISYDPGTQKVTLFNPWGFNNGTPFPALVTVSWADIQHSFVEWEVGNV